MSLEPEPIVDPQHAAGRDSIEVPKPTIAPLVVSLGIALLAAGFAMSWAFSIVGAIVVAIGLGLWVADLLPGRGHVHEPRVEPALRPQPLAPKAGAVESLRPGMPGYRMRLPSEVHPISAGIKGGVWGGLVMIAPALVHGIVTGHGIWYPVNLLAGMGLPGIGHMSVAELEKFQWTLFVVAVVIHAAMALVFGTVYGVLLPTLPPITRPFAWGGLLAPLVWTAASYSLMGMVNPALAKGVDWPWFIVSQFIFGIAAATVILLAPDERPVVAGLLGGAVGGLLMPIPAMLWGVSTGRGMWYPVNLLAGMVLREVGQSTPDELARFHPEWIAAALIIHAVLALGFGVLLGAIGRKLPPIPAPISWGGLVIPLLWTAVSYGLMGVANPLLQARVDWPWFVASQFVFGVVAAIVVVRSEMVHIPPAGRGPDRVGEFLAGESGSP
jgi:hypothetical protein